jgi:hypothetical protein
MRKGIALIFLTFLLLLYFSCAAGTDDNNSEGGNNGNPVAVKTGKVTFFNESSYSVRVLQDSFGGAELLVLNPGQTKTADVRTSDNNGVGSTFAIKYKYRIMDGTELASGQVEAEGLDPNVQLNIVIDENKSYTLQIPQPKNLEFPMAFIKILNASASQFELHHLGAAFKQAGNKNIPVPAGKTGVYQLDSSAEGTLYSGYTIHNVFQSVAMPDFTVKNNYIYDFTYDGSGVVKGREQKIIFN